jgi:hypothetical protein
LVTLDYTLSESELDALLALPSSDVDHFFGTDNGFGIPSSDSFSFDFGDTFNFGFGDHTNVNTDFVADLFTNSGIPPVQSPDAPAPLQEWPLTLPSITASLPVPTPDTVPSIPAAPIPTRRRRREEVDLKNIVSERRPRKQRARES